MECLQYQKITSGCSSETARVLNLVINGMPSIPLEQKSVVKRRKNVLNLVINGMPSIQLISTKYKRSKHRF